MSITLKSSTTLRSARTRTGYDLKVYDDCWGTLWLYGHEYGPTMLIRAEGVESAHSIAIDASKTINADEMWEAYGFDNEAAYQERVTQLANPYNDGEYPDLSEGYQYQSNSSGTGIVNVGYYEWYREAEASDFQGCERLRITVVGDYQICPECGCDMYLCSCEYGKSRAALRAAVQKIN